MQGNPAHKGILKAGIWIAIEMLHHEETSDTTHSPEEQDSENAFRIENEMEILIGLYQHQRRFQSNWTIRTHSGALWTGSRTSQTSDLPPPSRYRRPQGKNLQQRG